MGHERSVLFRMQYETNSGVIKTTLYKVRLESQEWVKGDTGQKIIAVLQGRSGEGWQQCRFGDRVERLYERGIYRIKE